MGQGDYKGILLAGGNGTRLHPLTTAISKHLLPVYDKPLIYYPLSVLMLAGIREILVISSPRHLSMFQEVLGDGRRWGISLAFAEQAQPRGIAEALVIGEDFIGHDNVALALGDNIFFGHSFSDLLHDASRRKSGATVFAYPVHDPERYGIATLDEGGQVISIDEKPSRPQSNLAVTGLYFYDNRAPGIARSLIPSPRGELEITDVNDVYLKHGDLNCMRMGRGSAWLDAGTCEALLQASEFVHTIQRRQGLQIACLEEVAFNCGYIGFDELQRQASLLHSSEYGSYLCALVSKIARDGAPKPGYQRRLLAS